MAKLSEIFENIHDGETSKHQYFAEHLLKSFLIENEFIDEAFDIETIKEILISEAYNKNSLEESLHFLVKVEQKIDEGLISGAIGLALSPAKLGLKVASFFGRKALSLAAAGSKALIDSSKETIKDYWEKNGITPDIKTWNNNVIKYCIVLEKNKQLNNSYKFDTTCQFIFETDATTDENAINGVSTFISDLRDKLVNNKKFGITTDNTLKFYKIEKVVDETASLYDKVVLFGDSRNGIKKPFLKMKKGKRLSITIPENASQNTINIIKNIITAIKNDPKFKMKKTISDKSLEDCNEKVTVSSSGKTIGFNNGRFNFISIPAQQEPEQNNNDAEQNSAETNPEPIENPVVVERKNILVNAINNSNVKTDNDKFYTKIRKNPDDVWSSFLDFAKSNNYKITSILSKTNGDVQRAAPMDELEYLAYTANLKFLIAELQNQPYPSEYNQGKYKNFLSDVLLECKWLYTKINRKMKIDLSNHDVDFSDNFSQNTESPPPSSGNTSSTTPPSPRNNNISQDETRFNGEEL